MNLVMPILELAEVEPALAFYRDTLGFELKYLERNESSGKVASAELLFGDAPLLLGIAESTGHALSNPKGFSLYFYTDGDLDAYCEQLRAAGVTIDEEPRDQGWGDRTFTIHDPNGVKLWFAKVITTQVTAPEGHAVAVPPF